METTSVAVSTRNCLPLGDVTVLHADPTTLVLAPQRARLSRKRATPHTIRIGFVGRRVRSFGPWGAIEATRLTTGLTTVSFFVPAAYVSPFAGSHDGPSGQAQEPVTTVYSQPLPAALSMCSSSILVRMMPSLSAIPTRSPPSHT